MNTLKLAAILIIGSATLALRSQIITNGGLEFEPGDTALRTVLPNTSYAGWTSVGPGDVEFIGPPVMGPAIEGQGLVDLNGVAFQGGISQVVNSLAGVSYMLGFAMSGNPGLPGQPKLGDKTMSVFWDGVNVGSFLFQHQASDTQQSLRWEFHNVVVVGTGTNVLTFASTTSAYNDAGPVLDAITLTVVPEPSSLALLAVTGLAVIRRIGRSRIRDN